MPGLERLLRQKQVWMSIHPEKRFLPIYSVCFLRTSIIQPMADSMPNWYKTARSNITQLNNGNGILFHIGNILHRVFLMVELVSKLRLRYILTIPITLSLILNTLVMKQISLANQA